jgi:hypothetical protein
MKDQNIKTIRFPITADSRLQKMADKCGLTRIDFFIAMVDYFYKSKKDPRDINDELLKKELVKRSDTTIGFIRTMEEELLRPLKKDTEKINEVQKKIVNYFNEHIINHNSEQKTEYDRQIISLNKTQEFIKRIDQAQVQKQFLKEKFSKILEYYFKAREPMGVMTKQVEKDNLIKNVRQQLENL